MSKTIQLSFRRDPGSELLLPEQCSIDLSCYEDEEVREAVAETIKEILSALTLLGFDLRALDGITLARDCQAAVADLQTIPEGLIPLETTDPPDTMELGRTVAVWREKELRFPYRVAGRHRPHGAFR